jgi:methylphosphotriester-DNA--protein-cysteine methyltransferase
MTPARYQRLRRLKRASVELARGRVHGQDVAKIVARHGFTKLHRFVLEYWEAYGEMPPIPPRHESDRKV